MQYADVSVVVDGAVDQDRTFVYRSVQDAWMDDGLAFDDFIDQIEVAAKADGLETLVYVQRHEHTLDVEDCTCAQYAQDHAPDYAFNSELRTR